MSNTSTPKLLPAGEYIASAISHIEQAKRHVTLFTMIITHDRSTTALIDALCAAAERGVSVNVSGDIFTLPVMLFESKEPWHRMFGFRDVREMTKRLKKSGVSFTWIGQLGPLLYARRTHLKWCVVDDDVFCFGGVNLYLNGLNNIDYMLLLHDPVLASRLEAEHQRIHTVDRTGKRYRSFYFSCSAGEVLVDGGAFGNSIIYDHARQLARKAANITYVSQYQPSGSLARILRDKNTQLYYNRWQSAFGMNKWLLHLSATFGKQTTHFQRPGYLHAKFMIFTMPNGNRVAITGTHNFGRGSVLLGTREIALETHDDTVIDQLTTYFKDNVA